MDGRGDRGESVAIIGMACRFPGARDPAEFHDLAVAGRDMFQPVAALPGRPLRAAVLDDWSAPQIADDPATGGLWSDAGPVRKLAAEMTALALADAGLRETAGTCRTGLIIASSVPELGEQVREEFGFPARGAADVCAGRVHRWYPGADPARRGDRRRGRGARRGEGGKWDRPDALPRHGQVRRPAAERVRGHELRPAAPTADLHDHRPPGHRRTTWRGCWPARSPARCCSPRRWRRRPRAPT